ncbi:MAG: amidohydrolase family protein, partial [Pseudomonadota bacterium]|nr:amidohydrolase family protein [Pseudomonadota bacterium]
NKTFRLQGREISVTYDNTLVDEYGRLAGSDIDMATAVRNSLEMLEVDLPQAARMASLYPATFLGLQRDMGRIEPGYRADLVLVNEGIEVLETWIAGSATK